MISVFDMFKVGVGPSSSHTVGPMKAAKEFVDELIRYNLLAETDRLLVDVYGSLALTGRGHNTDTAIIMGLMGYLPDNVDIERIDTVVAQLKTDKKLAVAEALPEYHKVIEFDFLENMPFHFDYLPRHENGVIFKAFNQDKLLFEKTYYSIGGGFIVSDENFDNDKQSSVEVPFPYKNAADLLKHCKEQGLPLASLMWKNELALHSKQEISDYLAKIWRTMDECIEHGLHTEGLLPGPLKVVRRAAALRRNLLANDKLNNDPMQIIDWINLYALAVNEENAAGGRVVTAPTNGACGIVPAVLAYYRQFVGELTPDIIERYFLTTSAIGSLYKMNASISGAEVGCQGEVGVACSMAAAGLAEIMGGSPDQVCIAAEIAMEHNLGLTCDPVGGQVQVPCIERNAIASVKAINACRMALRLTSQPRVTLDKVIETMYETGRDMNAKYRETSTGGLAIKIVPCD
ncbi:L-serine ammonia-lyase [Vespertiliibacter pulmonis]|uniref:L-serine dehydratase n=1 Tax=Vespertiliibacter pulmonis TaxID=1443036 RepID=A0A3N4VRI9_9PAST|nr:L-serine ammonia-lyase [Vespertiliibacter pulmonis]QLB21312.1 L-serine ammonia-lyase [Vespertiliibacter pulmonis]RPE85722.1 L-serine dehydratase [Vespertiliibacter pulmonis]